MIDQHAFEIPGSDGRPIRAVAHGAADAPPVLIAHGFKGFKDWGGFPWIADTLAARGLRAIRFDFSHNGVEQSDFDRLDLFLLDTPTRHQEDLRALANYLDTPFGLLGHSRGGGDAILFAADEPRAQVVCTLASVSSTVFEPAGYDEALRTQGYLGIPNGRTKQLMPVGRHAFESGLAWSIEDAATRLACPALFVHGTADEAVAPEALDRLGAWCREAETLRIVGAGHTFGVVHPFQGPTPHMEAALERIGAFLAAALR